MLIRYTILVLVISNLLSFEHSHDVPSGATVRGTSGTRLAAGDTPRRDTPLGDVREGVGNSSIKPHINGIGSRLVADTGFNVGKGHSHNLVAPRHVFPVHIDVIRVAFFGIDTEAVKFPLEVREDCPIAVLGLHNAGVV